MLKTYITVLNVFLKIVSSCLVLLWTIFIASELMSSSDAFRMKSSRRLRQFNTAAHRRIAKVHQLNNVTHRQLAKVHQSWKSRGRMSLWKKSNKIRSSHKNSSSSSLFRRKQQQLAPAKQSKLFYNPSDPLHGTRATTAVDDKLTMVKLIVFLFCAAYPNEVDLAFHKLFARLSTFEVNNAAAVRSVLDSARVLFWIGIAVGTAVGVAVPLATALPDRRRTSSSASGDHQDEESPSHYWNDVDHMAQSVIQALQMGLIKYQF